MLKFNKFPPTDPQDVELADEAQSMLASVDACSPMGEQKLQTLGAAITIGLLESLDENASRQSLERIEANVIASADEAIVAFGGLNALKAGMLGAKLRHFESRSALV